jgi:hypothetical protein
MNIKQKLIVFAFILLGCVAVNAGYGATVNADCGGVTTSIISCPQAGGSNVQDSGVWGVLILILNIMTAGVGILGVGGIVYGAILYASAGDDSSQVSQAKDIIKNVVIGLLAFMGMYLLLNFLIPGGIFS